MNKEEILQKANEYCNEKSYSEETLTGEFKDKFADFFLKKHGEEADINDENVLDDLKFNLNTAFSATSRGLTDKQKAHQAEVDDLKAQIEKLNKKVSKAKQSEEATKQQMEISEELKEKLARLEQFESDAKRKEKFNEILALAKKSVREDLHSSLEEYASDFAVDTNESSEGQAKKLTQRFQAIFKVAIGDTKPLKPKQTTTNEIESLRSLPKLKA
jgi:TolA-binding protein